MYEISHVRPRIFFSQISLACSPSARYALDVFTQDQHPEINKQIKWKKVGTARKPGEPYILWAPTVFQYTKKDTIQARASKLLPDSDKILEALGPSQESRDRMRELSGLDPEPLASETIFSTVVRNAARNMLIDEGRHTLLGKEKKEYAFHLCPKLVSLHNQLRVSAARGWFAQNQRASSYMDEWCPLTALELLECLPTIPGFELWRKGHRPTLALLDVNRPASAKNIEFHHRYGNPMLEMSRDGRKYLRGNEITCEYTSYPLPKEGEDPKASPNSWIL